MSQTFSSLFFSPCLLVLRLVEAVGEAALPAVVTVEVARHEDAGAALVGRTLTPQAVDLTVLIHLQGRDRNTEAAAAQLDMSNKSGLIITLKFRTKLVSCINTEEKLLYPT